MGDLKYYAKNGTAVMWVIWGFVLILCVGFLFKSIKSKLKATVLSVAFALSTVLIVAYFGLHPILCIALTVFWILTFVVIGLNNLSDDQKQKIAEQNRQAQQKADQLKADKQAKEIAAKTISCPNCHSKDVNFMGNDKKAFSAGKAVAGTVLAGPVGSVAGFAGKKGKNQWHCKNCGMTFDK